MKVRVVHFVASTSFLVEAFVDVEVDGWIRFNGLNLLRDGTLGPAQLSAWRDGQRLFRDAVQILDADLSRLVGDEILAAIRAHVALLPADRRSLPPKTVSPKPAVPPQPAPRAPAKPASVKPLPPPSRLLTRPNPLRAAAAALPHPAHPRRK
jgi:hypothetical protein